MNRTKRAAIYERLKSANPHPTTELEYRSPFELLIAVILSAQATDISVNKATRPLFAVANTPAALAALGVFAAVSLALVALRFDETNQRRNPQALQWQVLLSTWRGILTHPQFWTYALLALTYGMNLKQDLMTILTTIHKSSAM